MTQRLVLLKGTVNTSLCCGHAQRNMLTSDCAIAKQDPKIEEKKKPSCPFSTTLHFFTFFIFDFFRKKERSK